MLPQNGWPQYFFEKKYILSMHNFFSNFNYLNKVDTVLFYDKLSEEQTKQTLVSNVLLKNVYNKGYLIESYSYSFQGNNKLSGRLLKHSIYRYVFSVFGTTISVQRITPTRIPMKLEVDSLYLIFNRFNQIDSVFEKTYDGHIFSEKYLYDSSERLMNTSVKRIFNNKDSIQIFKNVIFNYCILNNEEKKLKYKEVIDNYGSSSGLLYLFDSSNKQACNVMSIQTAYKKFDIYPRFNEDVIDYFNLYYIADSNGTQIFGQGVYNSEDENSQFTKTASDYFVKICFKNGLFFSSELKYFQKTDRVKMSHDYRLKPPPFFFKEQLARKPNHSIIYSSSESEKFITYRITQNKLLYYIINK